MSTHLSKEGLKGLYRLFALHPQVCTDSRALRPDCLFFALRGPRFDGNRFATAALRNGAGCVVIDDPTLYQKLRPYPYFQDRVVYVPDSLTALQDLARYHRKQLGLPVLALTGTNGKTTTKNLIQAVLATRYRVSATQGNLNNHIGVPLTLLSFTARTQIGVVEMGASHPGEIAQLCDLAAPNLGLITNIGKAHLQGFGSIEGVAQCKGALYNYLTAYRGTLFHNADDPLLTALLDRAEAQSPETPEHRLPALRIPYGARYQETEAHQEGPYLRLRVPGYPPIESQLAGLYNVDNILAALAVGRHFHIEPTAAAQALARFRPQNLRSQYIEIEDNAYLLDAYNANPSSMARAVRNFAQTQALNGKPLEKILVLGDMLELGQASGAEHQALVQLVQDCGFQKVWYVGPCFAPFAPAGQSVENVEALQALWEAQPLHGAFVLIKGSRGIHLEKLLAAHL